MKFELLKVLDKILALYQLPRNKARFDKYLFLLQGANKDEMVLPIAGFNPMGKELALNKIEALIEFDAEELVSKSLEQINYELDDSPGRTLQVAINLIDDVEGSWSNYAVTDYKNKFEFDGLVNRNFCTPIFWTSETVSEEIIVQRTKEYVYRTIYWIKNGKPETLYDCLEQEVYVNIASGKQLLNPEIDDIEMLNNYYSQNVNSVDYNVNLNFFYGDDETKDLNFPVYGIPKNGGFEYAKYVALKRKEARY
ncbi:hypothetical protein FGF1_08790 [Flavobacteriaceae bacterium GF1]